MTHEIIISAQTKEEIYKELLPQIKYLIEDETVIMANLANIAAALKTSFDFLWVGFYLAKGNQLVLGPFQGPVACTRIDFNKGVCGTSYSSQKAIIVPDVEVFPGHIACSNASKSEIVIPIYNNAAIVGVLDVDSHSLNNFDTIDEYYLTKVCAMIFPI